MRMTLCFAATLITLEASNAIGQLPKALPSPTPIPIPATSITSATPGTLGLVIAGPAQIVKLNGTLLDRITSASVEYSNGVPVNYVLETLASGGGATYREIHLTAVAGAQVTNSTLNLVVKGLLNGGPPLQSMKVPVTVNILPRSTLVHRDALFATPINAVLAGASTLFRSCGTPSQHVFFVKVPNVSYAVTGTVTRLEQVITSVADRATFLVEHSLNPSNMFDVTKLVSLGSNAHPSPIPHSISEVRFCLEPFGKTNNWTFASASETGGAAQATVTLRFTSATFRARGMPSDPTGAVTGINVNILWGSPIVDAELPDLEYTQPEFDVRLPLTISNGAITYGSAQVSRRVASTAWTYKYLGSGWVQAKFEQFAKNRMTDIEQEIRKAFDAAATRNAISGAIKAQLQSAHGIGTVLGLRLSSNNMWEVQY